jgi:hypothetical protein
MALDRFAAKQRRRFRHQLSLTNHAKPELYHLGRTYGGLRRFLDGI